MVDFDWYRSFVAVYQAGTLSAAAEQRLMTPGTISHHLVSLEHALGLHLLDSTSGQMLPTEDGKAVYAQVVGAIQQLEHVSTPAALRSKSFPPHVNVGVPREFFYAEGIRRLQKPTQSPYRLQVALGQSAELIEKLEAGNLHAIIIAQPLTTHELHYQPLQLENFVLVAPPGLEIPPGMARAELIAWLEAQDWIAYANDLPIICRYWQEIFNLSPNLIPFLTLPDLLMILRAVSAGLGLSVLPEYLCRDALRDRQIQVLWQPDGPAPANQLFIACLHERLDEPEVQWFINAFSNGREDANW